MLDILKNLKKPEDIKSVVAPPVLKTLQSIKNPCMCFSSQLKMSTEIAISEAKKETNSLKSEFIRANEINQLEEINNRITKVNAKLASEYLKTDVESEDNLLQEIENQQQYLERFSKLVLAKIEIYTNQSQIEMNEARLKELQKALIQNRQNRIIISKLENETDIIWLEVSEIKSSLLKLKRIGCNEDLDNLIENLVRKIDSLSKQLSIFLNQVKISLQTKLWFTEIEKKISYTKKEFGLYNV